MNNTIHAKKEWLIEQYWKKGLSLREMEKLAGLKPNHGATITYWMDKHNIKRKKNPKGRKKRVKYEILDDINWLTEQYWGHGLDTPHMANIIGVAGNKVSEKMKKYKIPLKKDLQMNYHYPSWLVYHHYDKNMSIEKMAKVVSCSGDTISNLMNSYGFPINMQIEHTERNKDGKRWCYECEKWQDEICFHKNKDETDGLHASCKNCRKNNGLELRETERIIALQIYSKGNMGCKLCGCDDIDVLTFDHIKGGGYKHTKKNNIKGQFYRWLKKNDYPDGFRVLCWNCQHIEHINKYLDIFKAHTDVVLTHHAKKRGNRASLIRDELGRKYCPSCQRWLDEKEFNKSISTLDGLKWACKRCRWIIRKHDVLIVRIVALQIYSNNHMNCSICGCDDIDCLAIDHIDGGGDKHRKKINGKIESWLEHNNYPVGFRILCHNCNHREYLNRANSRQGFL